MRRLRVGVIGAGWWASIAHLPSLAADRRVELAAVGDPDPARGQAAATTFGIPRWTTDVDAMIADDDLDALVVATPHTTHHSLVAAALEAGRHVLGEKPMTTTAADAWDLVAIAERTGRHLAVGLTYQYAATAPRIRRAVREEIGELVVVNAEFSSNAGALYAATGDDSDDPAQPHGSTYADPALSGGGQGQTQLTHLIGGLVWATGRQGRDVSAFMADRGLPVDVVDALAFRLDGDALGVASSTGTTPAGAPVRHRMRLHGTSGVVEWDMLRSSAWIHRAGGESERVECPPDQPSYARTEVARAFVSTVLDEAPNPAPADAAAASVAIIEAAYRSAASGRAEMVTRGTLAG
jgi:predicted dehydrogenase